MSTLIVICNRLPSHQLIVFSLEFYSLIIGSHPIYFFLLTIDYIIHSYLIFFTALRTMAICAGSFVTLDEALSYPNNSRVDVVAVVAHVGPWDCSTLFPNTFRELTLVDE